MSFTSGLQAIQGRSVNHDSEPLVRPSDGMRGGFELRAHLLPGQHGVFGKLEKLHYDPRPENAVVDNPILVDLRENLGHWAHDGGDGEEMTYPEIAREWLAQWQWITEGDNPEQIDHARRVLTKLAALTKEITR